MAKVVNIDGAPYRMIERTTIANDFYVMKHLRAAGVADCTPKQGETAEEFAVRLLYAVIESGVPFELLAGLLLPDEIPDSKWTQEQAAQTAALIRMATAPEDKASIQRVIIEMLTGFFQEGLRYLKPLPSALRAPAQPAPEEAAAKQTGRSASKTSASLAKWSAPWRAMKSIGTRR